MSVTSETLGIINFTIPVGYTKNGRKNIINRFYLVQNFYPIRIIIVGCDDDSREVVQVFTNVYNAEN